jgi:hypothetical protein
MATKDSIRRWVKRHTNKHYCACGCGEFIEIKKSHHRRGIPKFIRGHNFSGEFNPRVEGDPEVNIKSQVWEVLSEEEKQRRLSNLKKFGAMEEHPGWKGGRIHDEDGYVKVRVQDHPFAKDGYVLEHRLVMEKFLVETYPNSPYLTKVGGKLYLKRIVVVHHTNEVKDDNRLDNLFPFPDSAAHTFWHKSPLSDTEKIKRIKKGLYKTYVDKEKLNTNDDS